MAFGPNNVTVQAVDKNKTEQEAPRSAATGSQDPIHQLVMEYLTVDGEVHRDALDIILGWYTYLKTYLRTAASQGGHDRHIPPVPTDEVDLSFILPIVGLPGNMLWAQHGAQILTLISQDIKRERWARQLIQAGEVEAAYQQAFSVARFEFIGFVISLVHPMQTQAQTEFEVRFRKILFASSRALMDANKNAATDRS